ncbi:TetR/AcrR family transcriptional regulator [Yinghuangia soli]|uniref:TetR/AcrR family transcriptional regulator n=1 Tax=Yinghuangia soli TaxID=2908204 RepID=A0AA41Q7L6_9ACTN|nr:helix-turn-helix domain-containing protein [Yinghuangia soli]MCF2532400.1 TetR/AcrR family transcriptional regulator [Yinghuangia soli]
METSAATRLGLMTTAERLFAERGINAVSAREIAAAAGQRNTNAVKYHFGSIQDLVDAIFRYRMEPINTRRTALIEESDRQGRAGDPYALAEAFVVPLAELLDELHSGPAGGSWYLQFCAQAAYTVHPDVAAPGPDDIARSPWTTGLHELNERALELGRATLPADLAGRRWRHFAAFAVRALAERELRLNAGPVHVTDSTALYVADLVDAGVGILTAPCRPETLRLATAAPPPAR